MKLKELIESNYFTVYQQGEHLEQVVSKPFCCDLLSIAMSRVPVDGVWITVMGNVNTLAVASLTEAACVILAEGVKMDETAIQRATSEQITVLGTELPIFEASLLVHQLLLDSTSL